MSIKVSQAFERTSAQPIDTSLALTQAEMLAVNDNLMPAYYFTICQDDGKVYLYDKSATPSVTTGKFTEFSGGGGGSSDVKFFTTTDTLSKEINGTKVVAAADLPGVTWSDLVVGSSVIKDAKGTMGLVTTITGTTSVTVTTATTSTPTVELTQAQYDALATKDPDTIYFITDSSVASTYMGAYDTIYSTTERVVGSWMGKPLYQKTIDCGSGPNNTSKTVAHGVANIDKIVSATSINMDNTHYDPIPNTNTATYLSGIYATATSIIIVANWDVSTRTVYATIQYTKTTDTASAVEYASPNDYSTSEKIVGTWTDGKPIYQKTWTNIDVTGLGDGANHNIIDLTDLNVDEMIDISGIGHQGTTGDRYDYPIGISSSTQSAHFMIWRRAENYIGLNLTYYSITSVTVTLKYTKTS